MKYEEAKAKLEGMRHGFKDPTRIAEIAEEEEKLDRHRERTYDGLLEAARYFRDEVDKDLQGEYNTSVDEVAFENKKMAQALKAIKAAEEVEGR